MATLPRTRAVTYEEWLEMPQTEGREEIVDGEMVRMPPAKTLHMRVIERLVRAFLRQLDETQCHVFFGSYGLVIRTSPLTCREPDIALFEPASMIEHDGYIHSPPQLAVEVLSPSESRRMTSAKLRDYESIGVPETWVVSPEAATVEVLLLEEGRFRRSAVLAEGILKPQQFPHVQIDITRIWPD